MITEQSYKKFTEVLGTKYGTFMKKSQNSVFCPENCRKFYRTFNDIKNSKFLVNMTLILNLISHTGWMGSIDLPISR